MQDNSSKNNNDVQNKAGQNTPPLKNTEASNQYYQVGVKDGQMFFKNPTDKAEFDHWVDSILSPQGK